MDYPKILVGAPVCGHYEFCIDRYLDALKNLDYPNYEVLLVDNTENDGFFEKLKGFVKDTKINVIRAGNEEPSIKMKMVIGRNLLREKALKEGFDYFFNLDQDVIPPLDVLKRLIVHNKDIVTGIYHSNVAINGKIEAMPVAYVYFSDDEIKRMKMMSKDEIKEFSFDLYKAFENNGWDFNEVYKQLSNKEIEGRDLIEIKMCGTGCIFISRKAIEEIPFRYNQQQAFDDVVFCKEAITKGLKIYADCSIICRHLNREKPWNWCNVGNEQMILYGANMFKRAEYKG